MSILDDLFGTGDDNKSGGDRSWTAPVYGCDEDGNDVTVSFGRDGTSREGQTLIASGHVSASEFYARDANNNATGHDHADGRGGYADRGAYKN